MSLCTIAALAIYVSESRSKGWAMEEISQTEITTEGRISLRMRHIQRRRKKRKSRRLMNLLSCRVTEPALHWNLMDCIFWRLWFLIEVQKWSKFVLGELEFHITVVNWHQKDLRSTAWCMLE